jgi:hypothetical protein
MSKYDVKVESVEGLNVHGTVDGQPFTASPFRWGSKMLMKVVSDDQRALLSQGAKVAVGAAAKKALKTAGLELPKAELVRPRKPKAETTEATTTEAETLPAQPEVAASADETATAE